MKKDAQKTWKSQNPTLLDPFDYDLYCLMLLEQPGGSLVRVEVMLDESILIVKESSPTSNISSQDIEGLYFNEISKLEYEE